LDELRDGMARGGVAISGLSGMGGVGKTALALQLAAELKTRYPDAGLYLDLQGVGPAPLRVEGALQTLIRPFVPPTAQLPDDVTALRGLYLSILHEQRAIVLLDNARDAAQVKPLLPPTSCAVIVTSRLFFILPKLVPLRLNKLSPDEACALLLEIAPRIGDCADEMARRLGYLPLALRLAASAVAHSINLTPQAYLGRLADARTRLGLTDDSLLEGPRSIEATIQLSYDLLEATQQARWLRLAVFAAPFDDAAAAALWNMDADGANTALTGLLDFSMVEFDAATARYRLHDLARDFAGARLRENQTELYAAQLRHATHYEQVLRAANELYKQGYDAIVRGLKLFDDERTNIEAGQRWARMHAAQGDEAAHLCMIYPDAGLYVLDLRQHPRERIAWLEAQAAAARQLKRRDLEGVALGNLGLAYADLGETRRAIEYYEKRLVIAGEIGDRRGEGVALGSLGLAYADLGETRRAIEYHEKYLAIAREIGDRRGEGAASFNMALALESLGETEQAIELAQAAMTILEAIEDPHAPMVRRKLAEWRGEAEPEGAAE
jgi:tetratricopeptide (TPR) repeat protein